MAEHGPNPESLPDQTERFVVDNVEQAVERVLRGDGVAIVERLGVSEAERAALWEAIRRTEPVKGNGPLSSDARYYYDFDHDSMRDLLSPVLAGMGERYAGQYFVCNMQVVEYEPGASLGEHVDYDKYGTDLFASEPVTSVGFIWVIAGRKELRVQPQAANGVTTGEASLTQMPDMLVALRGGAVEIDGALYPGVPHAVPPVVEQSVVLTFELGSLADLARAEADSLAD